MSDSDKRPTCGSADRANNYPIDDDHSGLVYCDNPWHELAESAPQTPRNYVDSTLLDHESAPPAPHGWDQYMREHGQEEYQLAAPAPSREEEHGCDWPDTVAERVLSLRAQLERLEDSFLVYERIQEDGSLRATLQDVVRANQALRDRVERLEEGLRKLIAKFFIYDHGEWSVRTHGDSHLVLPEHKGKLVEQGLALLQNTINP